MNASAWAPPRPRLFTVTEYYQMAEAGILKTDDRVELIEGVGPARFLDEYTVGEASGRTWQAEAIIIAVGGQGAYCRYPEPSLP